jgi:predicted transcriptional regulator
MPSDNRGEPTALTAIIVAAYLKNHQIEPAQIPALIQDVYRGLMNLDGNVSVAGPATPLRPAVPVRRSVTDEAIVCLDCGFKGKMIRRHLQTSHNLSVEQYREKWGLALDYPLVAPNYAAKRSQLAKDIGLGTATRRGRAAPAAAPAPTRTGRRRPK